MRHYFEIAGVKHYILTYDAILEPNEEFEEFRIDEDTEEGEKVYEKELIADFEIVPEPENTHDPNALAVMVKGKKVGYVARIDQEKVNRLLQQNVLAKRATLRGGNVKEVVEEDGKLVFSDEIGGEYDGEFFIEVEDAAPAPKGAKKAPAAAYRVIGIILCILSLLLLLAQPVIGVVGIILGVVLFVLGGKKKE